MEYLAEYSFTFAVLCLIHWRAIKIGNLVVPMVEYRPFQYVNRLSQTGSARVGVVKTFGQELNNTSVVEKLKEQFGEEGGNKQLVHDLVKSLSGVPVEPPIIIGNNYAYSNLARAGRGYNIVVNFLKNSALSVSSFTNISEPLGNVRKHVGMPGMLKSIFNIMKLLYNICHSFLLFFII